MRIVIFAHPDFLSSQSMPRFANFIYVGMKAKGHEVTFLKPQPIFYTLPIPQIFKKWMGYIDQYIIFPKQAKKKIAKCPTNTLFVFTDHALGPWVPLVANRPHVIHCHDFLAQRSAKGEIPENPTSRTGKKYQLYIRKGYLQGKNFISVSNRTKEDLHKFLGIEPAISEVVYNGMNQHIHRTEPEIARKQLSDQLNKDLSQGYLLHVGGNQWYKNRKGVIEIYNAWRNISLQKLPLLMIGAQPANALVQAKENSKYRENILFATGLNDDTVQLAYSGASVFLYPSLAEGFGWPIAEAMAAGCPVVTTGETPMNEVGGNAAIYIAKRPSTAREAVVWAEGCASTIDEVLNAGTAPRNNIISTGLENIKRFSSAAAIEKIESIYKRILSDSN